MKNIHVTTKEPIRINKFLGEQGVYSRRHVDKLLSENKIKVNNKLATLGQKVKNKDVIEINVSSNKKLVYALYNKPRGEVTGKIELLPGCDPVGRLDKESEGLLLYTNDYRVVDALLNPKNKREKEYEVIVREKATPRVETILKKGIKTQEAEYEPVKSVKIYNDGRNIRIIITEGKKHEIRRMLNALNLTIISLKRVRIMSFVLRGIKEKTAHHLSEVQQMKLLEDLEIK